MAVTKIWAIHDSLSRVTDYCSNPEKTKFTDLEQVLMYASDSKKTKEAGEKSFAVTGVNCKAETAAQEMAAVMWSNAPVNNEVCSLADFEPINFKRGFLPLVILSLLSQGDMFGYQLVQEISRQSGGVLLLRKDHFIPYYTVF